jgi:CubicO group peptidase (beta-lactamase class C family)
MEHTISIDLGIEWSAGAPMPTVLADEQATYLVFYLSDTDPGPERSAVITWRDCLAVTSGFPGDETQRGHRLWRGREQHPPYYGAVEVAESAWIADLAAAERTHPLARQAPFAQHRHFVLLFHDSTFECIATGYTVERRRGSAEEVVAELAAGRATQTTRSHVTFSDAD